MDYHTTNVRLRSRQWEHCKGMADDWAAHRQVRKQTATDVLDEAVERGLKAMRTELNDAALPSKHDPWGSCPNCGHAGPHHMKESMPPRLTCASCMHHWTGTEDDDAARK